MNFDGHLNRNTLINSTLHTMKIFRPIFMIFTVKIIEIFPTPFPIFQQLLPWFLGLPNFLIILFVRVFVKVQGTHLEQKNEKN